MQDPIRSSIPTMTVGTTKARATLELPVKEVPEDERWPEDWLPFYVFCLNRSGREALINSVLQILKIYVIIKPIFDLKQSMTVILF
jgi:hypothetical protein